MFKTLKTIAKTGSIVVLRKSFERHNAERKKRCFPDKLATITIIAYTRGMNKTMSDATRNAETVTISRAEYESLIKQKEEIAYLESINNWFKEQLDSLKKSMFGSKSEKSSEEVIGQIQSLFDEAETYAYLDEIETKQTVVAEHVREKRKNKFLLDQIPQGAKVDVHKHELKGEDRNCPICGEEMEEMGHEVVRTLEIQPAQFIVREDWYFSYKCHTCETDDLKPVIKKAKHAPSFYPGSNASPSLAAYIMTQKYVMGSPLYRLEMDFARSGYSLSRQTMSNWVIYAANAWLKPIYDRLHSELVSKEILHADETTLQVLHEPERKAESKSYMWLFRTGKYEPDSIVLYEYNPGRGGCYAKAFLHGFTGYLQSDGFAGYDKVPDVTHVGCMAHLKRKFHEAVATLPKGKKAGAAVEGEAYCTALFNLEEQFADLTIEERYIKRQELAKPIFDEFLSWSKTRNAAPKSKLGIALTYLKNNAKELGEYMNDGRLEISNNLAERSIKPFVIDRKNFLFANTPKGAEASAVTFSIIETAKENGLDPYKYLCFVFETAPGIDQSAENWIDQLLPKNAPEECKIPSDS